MQNKGNTLQKQQQSKLSWHSSASRKGHPHPAKQNPPDLGSLCGEVQGEFEIFTQWKVGTESATHSIFKLFGYCRNKDCKFHIHLFEPEVEKKTQTSKTFLEVKFFEKTSNLVMLCAQKILSHPHL